jgi:hypothetical protein
MSAFTDFVTIELPLRPVLLTSGNTGYDGDPNDGGVPPVLSNSPLGTLYLRASTGVLYQKQSATPGTWLMVGGGGGTGLSADNRAMAASVTVADGDLAVSTPLASTLSGWVAVVAGGQGCHLGNGTKVGCDCYFSADGGVTPRASGALQGGDLLYWNGSVAGFQLATTDLIDFIYSA